MQENTLELRRPRLQAKPRHNKIPVKSRNVPGWLTVALHVLFRMPRSGRREASQASAVAPITAVMTRGHADRSAAAGAVAALPSPVTGLRAVAAR